MIYAKTDASTTATTVMGSDTKKFSYITFNSSTKKKSTISHAATTFTS